MNVATIEMTVEEAEARLKEYEAVIRAERSVEDDALIAGYRAAARGLPVIQMTKTIDAGGFFENGFPRLAVVRADAQSCFVRWESGPVGQRLVFGSDQNAIHDSRGALVGRKTVRVEAHHPNDRQSMWRGASTIVPLIPPRHRPKRGRLSNFHLLWEVEEWAPVPPKDPALLRHIRGDLWAVLAVWDLTELERAVLSARA